MLTIPRSRTASTNGFIWSAWASRISLLARPSGTAPTAGSCSTLGNEARSTRAASARSDPQATLHSADGRFQARKGIPGTPCYRVAREKRGRDK